MIAKQRNTVGARRKCLPGRLRAPRPSAGGDVAGHRSRGSGAPQLSEAGECRGRVARSRRDAKDSGRDHACDHHRRRGATPSFSKRPIASPASWSAIWDLFPATVCCCVRRTIRCSQRAGLPSSRRAALRSPPCRCCVRASLLQICNKTEAQLALCDARLAAELEATRPSVSVARPGPILQFGLPPTVWSG